MDQSWSRETLSSTWSCSSEVRKRLKEYDTAERLCPFRRRVHVVWPREWKGTSIADSRRLPGFPCLPYCCCIPILHPCAPTMTFEFPRMTRFPGPAAGYASDEPPSSHTVDESTPAATLEPVPFRGTYTSFP